MLVLDRAAVPRPVVQERPGGVEPRRRLADRLLADAAFGVQIPSAPASLNWDGSSTRTI
jgi:hypothetical protein